MWLWKILGVLWAQENAEGSWGCCVGCLRCWWGLGARVFLRRSVSEGGSGGCWGWSQDIYGLSWVLGRVLGVLRSSGDPGEAQAGLG